MAKNNIPVSFDFFKRYTFHEECVDFMLKLKAKGNQQMYEKLVHNKECCERALRCYYEAFYLRPKIREKHPIRIKPVPKKIRDKLLLIPVQDACASGINVKLHEENDSNDSCIQDVVKGFEAYCANVDATGIIENSFKPEKQKKRNALGKQDVGSECSTVEDDSEPLTSPDISSANQENEKENSATVNKVDKAINDKDNPNKIATNAKMDKENPKLSSNVPQDNGKAAAASCSNEKQAFNYKALTPYIHCCPLTYSDFRKYSNIVGLVREFCEKQNLDAVKQRMVLERSYILFYLAPDHRSITPLNKIQLVDNCPALIKDKFFTIPTRLYLKEQKNLSKSQEIVTKEVRNVNKRSNNGNLELVATNNSRISDLQKSKTVKQQNLATAFVNNNNEENTTQHANTPDVDLNASREKCSATLEQPMSCIDNNQSKTTTTIATNKYKETNCKTSQHKSHQALTTTATEMVINLPVSLDEFKKYTYYEEIVEKLFKIKAKDNKDLFLKYKSSQEAFNSTLQNFYHSFYLLPAIRNFWPIRLKPMPNFLKNRFLSVPDDVKVTDLNNFKVEQLVSLEFTELSTAKTLPPLDCMEKSTLESQAPTIGNTSSAGTTRKAENIAGIKRTNNAVCDSSSPKRQKLQQTQDYANNNENEKKSYKDLLPYAHCCPITFSEFCKYTNISELFTGYCKKRYNSVKKLPFMLQRAYILYYLAPENRKFKPFNKLKILDNCPLNLKDKIFEIPLNLYIKDEKNNFQNQDKIQTETQTTTEHQISKTTDVQPKQPIEILENRLLAPTTLLLSDQFIKESNYCADNSCVFHHISSLDFFKLTNISNILPKPYDTIDIQNAFKKFIYKLIKEQTCDEKYVLNSALLCKLLKYNHICANCDNGAQTLINLNGTTTSSVSESDRLSNVTSATVVERCAAEKVSSIENQTESLATDTQTESLATDTQTQPLTTEKQPADIVKHLRRDKILSKFSQRLLMKLNQSYDGIVDFSSDCYKIFLECNEVPLKKILNDFCENNEDIVQRISNQTELYEAFQRYYYFKYITKYPEKLKEKMSEENCNKTQQKNAKGSNEEQKTINEAVVTRDANENTSNSEQINLTKTTLPLIQEKSLNNNNAFEKAKRIFFRYVDKTHTLSYVLRTSFGYKQAILRTVLSLTFEEFLEITSIYEGNELYNDSHIAECMYRYVFRTPLVWPTNLYITLEDLCKFLHKNNIRFENYSTMLSYISPKFLHWSTLLSCTNILECVIIDYEKRTGKILDTYDIRTLKQQCIEYYNRCWKHEKWLGGIPQVDEEFYKEHLMHNTQGDDVTTTDGSCAKENCEMRTENVDIVEAANESLACVEKTAEMNISATADDISKDFNFVNLPPTQQQIEMLPPEQTVSSDPLDNCTTLKLNVSSSTAESYDVVSLGELTNQEIKTEPAEVNLLSNLLFYEDEDSNMHCSPFEEEIVCLDNTVDTPVTGENLPPSQMDFEDSLEQRLYNVLMNSDDRNFILDLPQHFQSSSESNHGTACTQAFMQSSPIGELISKHLLQLPDASLQTNSENQNNNENGPNLKATETTHETNICLEHDMGADFLEYNPEKFLENLQDQHFSNSNATQMLSGNRSAEQAERGGKETPEAGTEMINSPPMNEHQQVDLAAKSSESTTLKAIQPSETSKDIHQSNVCQTRLPTRQGTLKTYAATKRSKSIATVKPLTKSGLVPQIQHNTRPLQTVTAYAATSSNDNPQGVRPVSEISSPTSVVLSLTPTNSSLNPSGKTTQNSSFQLQLSNLDGQIFISQELNKNCSVFDNSSLLRIVDHNYHKKTSQTGNQQAANYSDIIAEEPQLGMRTTHNISICRDDRALPNSGRNQKDSEQSDSPMGQSITISRVNQQQSCPRIIRRSTNSLCPTNDKVNKANSKTNTNNLVTAITVIIHQPTYHCTHEMVRKICLYREIIKFHYFKELTPQHISQYLLPSLEIGKSYTEALVSCENFKTRVSNRSISALFPFWPPNIQRDFLLVLDDLKEFHYTVYERLSISKQEDLRARILFYLLNTAPSFSLCQLIYENNNCEFSHCESIKTGNNPSYNRKPFKCLTNALSSNMLRKLAEMKKDLNGK